MAAAVRLINAMLAGSYRMEAKPFIKEWSTNKFINVKNILGVPDNVELSIFTKNNPINSDKLDHRRFGVQPYVDDINASAESQLGSLSKLLKVQISIHGLFYNPKKSLPPSTSHE